jgi:selenide,water dikinase
MGAEMQIGFSITGLLDRAPITVSGALPGDVLILTKPIGSGTLLAAEMRGLADGADIADCYELLLRGQGDASKILAQAHAMTDVTGFGLMGHLHNICVSSAVGAQIDVSAVPFMSGALDLAKRGIRSTIYQDNRAILPELDSSPEIDLLFDPQTAGGLLAAVDHSQANDILQNLLSSGHRAAVIGQITAGSEISLS